MKPTPLTLLLALGLFINSCKKEKLPKATQDGANTFGCKVDGKIYLPYSSGGLFSTEPIFVDNSQMDGFIITGSKNGGTNQLSYIIEMRAPYLTAIGTYDLKTYPYGRYRIAVSPGATYNTNQIYSGQLTITRCDNSNKIYSGTFFFTAIDTLTGQTVKVTNGRFDVKK